MGEWSTALIVSWLSLVPSASPHPGLVIQPGAQQFQATGASEPQSQDEAPSRHSLFVTRLLVDGALGIENRYRQPLAGAGAHIAFLKVGRFFVGAPGVMLASAPDFSEVVVMTPASGTQPPRRDTAVVLRHQLTPLLTQSVSWQFAARSYGYFYVSLIATKRVPVVDTHWDPAVAISFTPR